MEQVIGPGRKVRQTHLTNSRTCSALDIVMSDTS